MTTKPKAKKFRIRRSLPAETGTSAAAEAAVRAPVAEPRPAVSQAPEPQPAPPQPRAEPQPAPSRAGMVSTAAEVAGETDMDAIRREGLTGRQLRMARRVAQKHGLAPTSDFDAVRLLRVRGIDPFQRANMLELVVPGGGDGDGPGAPPADALPPAPRACDSTPRTSSAGSPRRPRRFRTPPRCWRT